MLCKECNERGIFNIKRGLCHRCYARLRKKNPAETLNIQPREILSELWQESGRWDVYGKELVRFKDRHERDFCLGPTHAEVITDLVRRVVRSYRELPFNIYQIQTKFHDEVRPRFGLMRGREFVMKDAYSFHADVDDCRREYENMFQTYKRIFTRCGLQFRPVEADTGAIGGSRSHEFQVLAESGEDAIVSCNRCDYAANVQKAEIKPRRPAARDVTEAAPPLQKVPTPGKKSVAEVAAFLRRKPEQFIKTLIYKCEGGELIAALVSLIRRCLGSASPSPRRR